MMPGALSAIFAWAYTSATASAALAALAGVGVGSAADAEALPVDVALHLDDSTEDSHATHLLQADVRRSHGRSSRAPAPRGGGGGARQQQQRQHPWPHSRGLSPEYGSTAHSMPGTLNESFAWSWQHPEGQYHTVIAGSAVIDEQGNVYFGANDGVRKLSPGAGSLLWHYARPGDMNNQPTLHGELLLGNTATGYGYALDLETGSPVWERKFADRSGKDTGYPGASEGLFLMGVDGSQAKTSGNERIIAVVAATGEQVWEYRPSVPSWNFMPVFPGDGTAVFMDWTGGVYKLGLHNGTLLWHSPVPGAEDSFSDGGVILGPEAAYSCSNPGSAGGQEGEQGLMRAVDLESGAELWKHVLPQPCNSWPAVGHINPGQLAVVATVGSFAIPPTSTVPGPKPLHGGMMAFDAATGQLLWQFQAPPHNSMYAMGDEEGLAERLEHPESSHKFCLPAHWSAPTIAGDGSIYAGRLDGKLYRVRGPAPPPSGDGTLAESLSLAFPTTAGVQAETFDARGGFLHGGTAWTESMMAVASCDTLFVFKKQP